MRLRAPPCAAVRLRAPPCAAVRASNASERRAAPEPRSLPPDLRQGHCVNTGPASRVPRFDLPLIPRVTIAVELRASRVCRGAVSATPRFISASVRDRPLRETRSGDLVGLETRF